MQILEPHSRLWNHKLRMVPRNFLSIKSFQVNLRHGKVLSTTVLEYSVSEPRVQIRNSCGISLIPKRMYLPSPQFWRVWLSWLEKEPRKKFLNPPWLGGDNNLKNEERCIRAITEKFNDLSKDWEPGIKDYPNFIQVLFLALQDDIKRTENNPRWSFSHGMDVIPECCCPFLLG